MKNSISESQGGVPYTRNDLPKYVKKQNIDKTLIIQFLCRNCRVGRFGVLNKPYPGKQEFEKSKDGEFEATCLYCGRYIEKNILNLYR